MEIEIGETLAATLLGLPPAWFGAKFLYKFILAMFR